MSVCMHGYADDRPCDNCAPPTRPPDPCPTCQGRFWHLRRAVWVYRRETVGMVCQGCGRDYSEGTT